jgi:rubrerythrin
VERAARVLRDDWDRHAGVAERRAAAAVIDHNAPQITCPVCGATFATGPTECPRCGLNLV